MDWLFNKLNTPIVGLAILIFLLTVDGLLLYRQAVTPTASAPPTPSTIRADTGAAPSELERPALEAPSTPAETPAPSKTPASEDLRGSIRRCEGDRKECVQKFVAVIAPEATYIGSRTDLNAGGSGRNKEISYFEDPNLGPCEYTR